MQSKEHISLLLENAIGAEKYELLQMCPLHNATEPTLKVSKDPVSGCWMFSCKDSRCGFSGNAIAVFTQALALSTEAVIARFRQEPALRHLLFTGCTDAQLEAYLASDMMQIQVNNYLSACQKELRSDRNGTNLRYRLNKCGLLPRTDFSMSAVPTSLGMLYPDNIPDILSEYRRSKYRKSRYAVYPYTYNGRVTSICIQNFDDAMLPTHDLSLSDNDVGIFMEDNITENMQRLYVAPTEAGACALSTLYLNRHAGAAPVVAIRNFPLPQRCSKLESICIISTPQHKLTLTAALRLFTAKAIVEGCSNPKIKIYVYDTCEPHYKLNNNIFSIELITKYSECRSLIMWVLHTIKAALNNKNNAVIYDAFKQAFLPHSKRVELIQAAAAEGMPKDLQDAIELLGLEMQDKIMLANGNVIKCTSAGMEGVAPTGRSIRLTNIVLTVDECVMTHDGKSAYICKASTTSDTSVTIPITLYDADFKNNDVLSKAVRKAFVNAGHAKSAYVAFYAAPGYKWDDIVAKLSEGKPIRKEVNTLGIDRDLQINFPRATIQTVESKVTGQQHVFTICDEVLRYYKGICHDANRVETLEPFRKLVETAKNNTYVAGLVAGIAHVLYQIKTGLEAIKNDQQYAPRHMLYVEPQPGAWQHVFQQLSLIFTGSDTPAVLGLENGKIKVDDIGALGVLPAIALLPHATNRQASLCLGESPVSIISVIDSDTATALSPNDARVSFVVQSDYREQDIRQLHPADIIELQQAMAGFILAVANHVIPMEIRLTYKRTRTPARDIYIHICDLLGVSVTDHIMLNMIKTYYAAIGVNGINAFFHKLYLFMHENYGDITLDIRNGPPNEKDLNKDNPPTAFVMDDAVLLKKEVVTVLNKRRSLSVFSIDSITKELVDKKCLKESLINISFDTSAYWILTRETWDKYIMRLPINLETVTQGNVIYLPRMIA